MSVRRSWFAVLLACLPAALAQDSVRQTGMPALQYGGADLVATADELRRGRCAPPAGLRNPLRRREALDRAAKAFSDGLALDAALQRVGYVATESAGLRVDRASDAGTLRSLVESRFCSPLANGMLSEAGAWRSGDSGWLIVASAPQPAGPRGTRSSSVSGSASPVPARGRREVLVLVNAARATGRLCGDSSFAASPPLTPSSTLDRVAQAHALDMARRNYFDHTGADGSSPPERVTRGGYDWRISGENLALGRMTAREAVDGWLASPGHCANIMDPRFTETGIALAPGRERGQPTYWVQTFAAPRPR